MNGISLHLHQQIAALAHHRYDTVIEEGGVGSGKSLGDAVILLERSRWDTAQWGGLFANTWPQLQAVTGEIYKHLDAAGVERVFNCRPPKEWVEEWRAKGIKTPPPRDRYTNVIILRTGVHIYLATLLNQNYKQLRGWEFGWIIIEEFTAGPTQPAVEFAMERVRCGEAQFSREFEAWRQSLVTRCASGATIEVMRTATGTYEVPRNEDGTVDPEAISYDHWCRVHHRHTKYLKGNPPEEDNHWTYAWYAAMDAHAAKLPGGVPVKNADSYPNLLRGIGPVIYIPSRTRDNEKHLSAGYIENQLARLDEETAKKRLDGVRSRRRSGAAYNKYSSANEISIEYHPDRELYLCFDFNTNPTVCALGHPLYPGEYPNQGEKAEALRHVGIFGEFFHIGGMDAYQLAEALVAGQKGSHGFMPANWQGLRAHEGRVKVFGDATGGIKKKTFTGTSPWKIINGVLGDECRGRYSVCVPAINPLVFERVRSMNGALCTAAGYHLLFHDPGCVRFKGDLEAVPLAPDGTIVKPGGPRPGSTFWQMTHISDGVGYLAHWFWPMGRDVSDREPHDTLPVIEAPRFVEPMV
jgi:hypothetical protein